MTEVSPFHSKNHLHVYHACSSCRIGKRIQPSNKASGTGGLRLCLCCEKLLAQEGSQMLSQQDYRREMRAVPGCDRFVPWDFIDKGNLQAHFDQPHGSNVNR